MELDNIIKPLLKWWWLIAISFVIAAISSYYTVSQQPPTYQSRTTLMAGRMITDPNPNSSQFYLAQQLAATYADMANREPLQQATMQALGMEWLPGYSSRPLPNSQFLEIIVTDVDPERAYAVAQELANQLILSSPTNELSQDQDRIEFINGQLDLLRDQIEETQSTILELQTQLETLNSASQIAETQEEIEALTTRLNTLRGNYADLLANSQSGAFNVLTVIEPANLPGRPAGSNKLTSVALAAAVGLGIAVGAAYLLEYIDKSVKTPDQVRSLVGKPAIGLITKMGGKTNAYLYVKEHPQSQIADAFRRIRTQIELLDKDRTKCAILITSPGMGDGKSVVASNLATVYAQTGVKVALIETDFHRSNIHKALEIPNECGLSCVLQDGRLLSDVQFQVEPNGLYIIPCGPLPPNPTELLGSNEMERLLSQAKIDYDVIILDSAPFGTTDALVLSSKVDCILPIIRLNHTELGPIEKMIEHLSNVEANMIGVVLNQVSNADARYAGYYHQYYAPIETNQIVEKIQSWISRKFRRN